MEPAHVLVTAIALVDAVNPDTPHGGVCKGSSNQRRGEEGEGGKLHGHPKRGGAQEAI